MRKNRHKASFSYIAKIPGCRRLEQSGKFWNISEHNFCNFWGEVGMVVDHPWSHLEDRTHFYLLDMIENDSWSFPIIWNFYNKCEHHAGLLRCDRRLSLIIINFNVVISNLRSRWTITITDFIRSLELRHWNIHWKIYKLEKVCSKKMFLETISNY